jgi:DNA polymerase-3 subunit epsilon
MACLAFDLETSGVSPLEDRIVTAALVEVRPGHRPTTTRYVVDPGVEIPAEATEIHGYTQQRAMSEATHSIDQALFEIAGRIALWLGKGRPLVVMNGSFDLTMLEAECHRHDVDGLVARLDSPSKVAPVIDVLVLDKYADAYRKGGRRLEQLCATYGVRHVGAHDAAGDALAAARLWPRIIAQHPAKFRGQTLGGLHTAQIGWRRDQCNSLRAYFDRKGTAHDGVDPGWPFHTRLHDQAGVA